MCVVVFLTFWIYYEFWVVELIRIAQAILIFFVIYFRISFLFYVLPLGHFIGVDDVIKRTSTGEGWIEVENVLMILSRRHALFGSFCFLLIFFICMISTVRFLNRHVDLFIL